MRFVLWGSLLLVAIGVAALLYNHYDVQKRGNGPDYDPKVKILRTPDSRFAELADFPYAPHYLEIEDPGLGTLRIHYLDEGPRDGPVVVLLHGQATWSYSFRHMIPVLTAAGYRVVAPDLVGFGRSDTPADWEYHTFARHVGWLTETLQALEIRGATGFLFDWGGYFGLPVAIEHPEFFDRLVLNTTTVPRANSLVGAAWVAGWRRYILKPEVFPISGMVAEMTVKELDTQTLTGLDAPYPDESYKGGPRRMPMMIPATPMHPAHSANTRVWEALAGWRKPTLTQISESLANRGFNPERFHEQIPGTRGQPHIIFPDRGFFIIEENPEELAAGVVDFIASTN